MGSLGLLACRHARGDQVHRISSKRLYIIIKYSKAKETNFILQYYYNVYSVMSVMLLSTGKNLDLENLCVECVKYYLRK